MFFASHSAATTPKQRRLPIHTPQHPEALAKSFAVKMQPDLTLGLQKILTFRNKGIRILATVFHRKIVESTPIPMDTLMHQTDSAFGIHTLRKDIGSPTLQKAIQSKFYFFPTFLYCYC